MARNKIHKVTLGKDEYFIHADTKQGAIRDTLAYLKETAVCEVAGGQDLFYHGVNGGYIINPKETAEDSARQAELELEEPKL